jgi:hypothetical protein
LEAREVGKEEEGRAAAGEACGGGEEMPHPGGARRDCEEAEVIILKQEKRHPGEGWRDGMGWDGADGPRLYGGIATPICDHD